MSLDSFIRPTNSAATAIAPAKTSSDGVNEPCTRLDHSIALTATTAIYPAMLSAPCDVPSGAG